MKLEQQVISLELAKRLKELGVKQNSHFAWDGRCRVDGGYDIHDVGTRGTALLANHGQGFAAFNVAELGEMLPRYLNIRGFSLEFSSVRSNVWRVYYTPEIAITGANDGTEADARAEMLVYLIENKLIPPTTDL